MSAPIMSFVTRSGAAVLVATTGHAGYPYRWTCSAAEEHRSLGNKSLVLTRREAEAHAANCTGGVR